MRSCFQIIITIFARMNKLIQVGGRLIDLTEPRVMGILNATPDSFYAGSRVQTERAVCDRVEQILREGGTMVDVGACSTRPGGDVASEAEETERLRMALGAIRKAFPDVVISVDTFRPTVAKMAIEEYGADIINDVSGGGEPTAEGEREMFRIVAHSRVPYILMSSKSNIHDMLIEMAESVQQLRALGQNDIIIDPGFGFGKTLEDNYTVLSHLDKLQAMELPVLVGVSRKRMIHQLLGVSIDEALNGTTAVNTIALMKGASILRVHDVKAATETVRIIHNL